MKTMRFMWLFACVMALILAGCGATVHHEEQVEATVNQTDTTTSEEFGEALTTEDLVASTPSSDEEREVADDEMPATMGEGEEAEAAPVRVRAGTQHSVASTPLVSLTAAGPSSVNQDEVFDGTLTVVAQQSVARVVVRHRIPEGMQVVKTEPAAGEEDGLLVWRWPWLEAGEEHTLTVSLKAAEEGEYVPCASVEALPRACYTVTVTRAEIAITKHAPREALLNEMIEYTIVVKNVGNGVAKDVVVYDQLPEGFKHDSGSDALTFQVGDLAPDESKTITINVEAAARGEFVNKARADASNANSVAAEAPTVVMYKEYKVYKRGDAEQFLSKRATYEIIVTNLGDVAINDMQVVDIAAPETQIVAAEDADTVTDAKAVWTIPTLAPGDSKIFTVKVTSRVAGTHTNRVKAMADDVLRQAQAPTLWKGMPAVLLEVVDTEDPVMIGDETTYDIKVTNQGTSPDRNVQITARFPDNLEALTASGATAGAVEGAAVTFEPYDELGPKESISYKIRAKGVNEGDARVKVFLTSDLLKKPVPEEESTHVY
jgi:uncharacterized repeat protein (TIGR01451 family)